jgi:hypothetical protein
MFIYWDAMIDSLINARRRQGSKAELSVSTGTFLPWGVQEGERSNNDCNAPRF